MTVKTKDQMVWCDNGHPAIPMIYSHETTMLEHSIYICTLCNSKKEVSESPLTGAIKIEWKDRTRYPN